MGGLAVGTVAFCALWVVWAIIVRVWSALTICRPGSLLILIGLIAIFLLFLSFIILISFPIAIILTVIPFLILLYFPPIVFRIKYWLFFIVSGALIGIPASAGLFFIYNGLVEGFVHGHPPPFSNQWLLLLMCPHGALGGLTYWYLAIKRPQTRALPLVGMC
jgi:hypothetical protein